MSTLTIFIQPSAGSHHNKAGTGNISVQIGEKNETVSICRWIKFYVQSPKDLPKGGKTKTNLLEVINKFIDDMRETYQNQLYFCVLAKDTSKPQLKTILLGISRNKIKFLGINPTKHLWALYGKNYKNLMKETKIYINRLFMVWKT